MKRLSLILSLAMLTPLAACGDDGGDDGGIDVDPMPSLSATQLDRAGRPAIVTALVETFNPNDAARLAARDKYKGDANPANWKGEYTGAFVANGLGTGIRGAMAIIAGLADSTNGVPANVCDDLADHTVAALDPGNAGAGPFEVISSVFADDMLYVNSGTGTCDGGYLHVEVTFATAGTLNDCGGRKIEYDVVDASYTALALGILAPDANGDFAVPDGVDEDPDGPPSNQFPFLNAP